MPRIGEDGFAALADRLGEKRLFSLRVAAAGALAGVQPGARARAGKIAILMRLADDLAAGPERPAPHRAALTVIDEFLAEALAAPGGAESLHPGAEQVGDLLESLVAVIGGKAADAPSPIAAAQDLRTARAALIRRVQGELLRPRRLRPGAFWNEVHQVRRLADAMAALAGPDLSGEDIAAAFIYRASRMVQPDAIAEALDGASDLREEIQRLLRLEESLVGQVAREKLVASLRVRLITPRAESELARGPGHALDCAARIAALQAGVLKSTLPDEGKTEIAGLLDGLCMLALAEARVFESFANGAGAPLDRAGALLKLARRGGVTRGRASAEASARAHILVRQAVRDGQATPEKLDAIKALIGGTAA